MDDLSRNGHVVGVGMHVGEHVAERKHEIAPGKEFACRGMMDDRPACQGAGLGEQRIQGLCVEDRRLKPGCEPVDEGDGIFAAPADPVPPAAMKAVSTPYAASNARAASAVEGFPIILDHPGNKRGRICKATCFPSDARACPASALACRAFPADERAMQPSPSVTASSPGAWLPTRRLSAPRGS